MRAKGALPYILASILFLLLILSSGAMPAASASGPSVIFTPFPPAVNDPTPQITGSATASLGNITSVECRIWHDSDGDGQLNPDHDALAMDWTAAQPKDGIFDSGLEEFVLVSSPLSQDGRYFVQGRASDEAGTGEAPYFTISLFLDLTPATAAISLVLNSVVYGTASDPAPGVLTSVQIMLRDVATGLFWDGLDWSAATESLAADGSNQWSFQLPPLDPSDTYEIRAIAIDLAGNRQEPGAVYTFKADAAPPTITLDPPIPPLLNHLDVISGGAADNHSELQKVQLTIKDDTGNQYWQGSSWAAEEKWLDATGVSLFEWTLNTSNVVFSDGKQYTVRARAIDKAGNPSEVVTSSFTFDGSGPQVTLAGGLSESSPGVYVGSFTGTATDAFSKITAVEYRIGGGSWENATPSDGVYDELSEAFSFTTSELDPDVSTQIEVRATDAHGNKKDLVHQTLIRPVNQQPAHESTDVCLTPTLRASEPVGFVHTKAEWEVRSASGSYSSPVYFSGPSTLHLTSITVPQLKLKSDSVYYWRVRYSTDDCLFTAFSAETSFRTTSLPPYAPTNVSPEDGAAGLSLTPQLTSSPFSDPDADDTHKATQWQVSLAGGTGFESGIIYDSGLGSGWLVSITLPEDVLDHATQYFWRVRYQDSGDALSPYSQITSFSTMSLLPAQPVNISPANASMNISLTPILQAGPVPEGITHVASQWQIRASSRTYENCAFDSGADTVNLRRISVPDGHLHYSVLYYWRVRYQDDLGNWSDYSAETSFSTVVPDNPVAAFSASPQSGQSPLSVQFTNESSGLIESWTWDLDGDGKVDSTDKNPTWTYERSGTFTVSLTVAGPSGTVTETKEAYITVEAPGGGLFSCLGCSSTIGFTTLRDLATGWGMVGAVLATGVVSARLLRRKLL